MTAQNQPLTAEERAELEAWAFTLEAHADFHAVPPVLDDQGMIAVIGFDEWADYCSFWVQEEHDRIRERELLRLGALRKVLAWVPSA